MGNDPTRAAAGDGERNREITGKRKTSRDREPTCGETLEFGSARLRSGWAFGYPEISGPGNSGNKKIGFSKSTFQRKFQVRVSGNPDFPK